MFYLIETDTQFKILQNKIAKSCYIDYIYGNDNIHPALAKIIAVYISNLDEDKGYILPIKHPECINLPKDKVFDYIKTLENIYVLDKKAALHANPLKSYTDIQYKYYYTKNEPFPNEFDTQAHTYFYRKFPQIKVNKMIPIGKHLERCNNKYNEIIGYTSRKTNEYVDNILLPTLYKLEQNGLKFNDKFDNYFTLKNKKYSIKDDHIYGWYNPFTTTGRPVNNFNGINFVGLKHDNGERDSFEPDNDLFIEMDYDGYHPRLIGDIVGFLFEDNVHNTLAQIYFKSKEITPQQYKESKTLTFKQIYGGIDKANLHHPFFRKTQDFIDIIWEVFNVDEYVNVGPYSIKKDDHPKIHAQKLFNYYIQATETYTNIEKIKIIQDYLKDKQTKLVLYIYDAFIFDMSKSDGKQTLIDLKNILSDKFPIKLKTGNHYGALK